MKNKEEPSATLATLRRTAGKATQAKTCEAMKGLSKAINKEALNETVS